MKCKITSKFNELHPWKWWSPVRFPNKRKYENIISSKTVIYNWLLNCEIIETRGKFRAVKVYHKQTINKLNYSQSISKQLFNMHIILVKYSYVKVYCLISLYFVFPLYLNNLHSKSKWFYLTVSLNKLMFSYNIY